MSFSRPKYLFEKRKKSEKAKSYYVQKRVHDLWQGHFDQKEIKRFLIIIISTITALFLISWYYYPPERQYSPAKDMISYLGDYLKNPAGWWYLSLAFMILGFSYFPLSFYVYRRIKYIRIGPARFFRVSMRLAGTFLILVGFFPDVDQRNFYISLFQTNTLHEIFAVLYFSFTFAAFFCYIVLVAFDQFGPYPTKILPRKISTGICIIFIVFFICLFYTQTYADRKELNYPYPGIYALSIWEWALWLHNNISFYLLTIILSIKIPNVPEDYEIEEKRKKPLIVKFLNVIKERIDEEFRKRA